MASEHAMIAGAARSGGIADPRGRARRLARLAGRLSMRTAYLLLGASILFALVIVEVPLLALAQRAWGMPLPALVLVGAVPLLAVGLLPGTHELQANAARTMLGATGELVWPIRPGWRRRVRSAAWTALHLILGGLAGAALFMVAPSAAMVAHDWASGRAVDSVVGLVVPVAMRQPLPSGGLLAAVLACCLATVVGAGLVARRLAPVLLGPSWRDRLQVAEARLRAEAQHRRLARELHDSVGHALSMVSLQAAAGGRTVDSDRDRAAASFRTIEDVARQAQDDLDHMLAALRDSPPGRTPEPGLDDLPSLVALHRRLGADIDALLDVPDRVPMRVGTTGYRIVAEALANAHRYAGPGRTSVVVEAAGTELVVAVRSPLASCSVRRRGGGRGLQGAAERAALFGGELHAGAAGRRWVVEARIPL